jgi:hypothetical protein
MGCSQEGSDGQEVTMTALAELQSIAAINSDPRGRELPTCPVCADSMIAAEASAFVDSNVISYLWTCDTCGYGFVTRHSVNKRFRCN